MTKQEIIKKMAHTLTYQGWGVSFSKGSGTYNDLSGGDLTITSPDGTVANLCIIVRKTSIYPDVEYGVYGEDF